MAEPVDIEVGAALPALRVGPITRTTLALFAGASGDHNPVHIDIEYARAAGFDDVFAHGMLSAAYVSRFLTGWRPRAKLKQWSVRFLTVTPVGATLTIEGHVEGVTERDGERLARLVVAVRTSSGAQTIAGTAVVAV